ncbi:MAG TPA: class I SAM-dependent methyltransferase, partial [Dehalococcoidia bacterium]
DAAKRARLGVDESGAYNSRPLFEENLRRFGVEDVVKPVYMPSVEAAGSTDTGPVRLLFIDSDHSYEGVTADIANWTPRVVPGGIVVFDDYYSAGFGVKQAVDELVGAPGFDATLRDAGGLFKWLVKR